MLICFVLCAVAVLPTAFSDKIEGQHIQQPTGSGSNSDLIRNIATIVSSLRNQPQMRFQSFEDSQPLSAPDDSAPSLYDLYVPLPPGHSLASDAPSRSLRSPLEVQYLLRRDTVLDSIGGGHLLRREARLDPLGGGHLLKRESGFSALDPIGGGHLLKREFRPRQLDSIGGGHLLKRLDSIGGGHLLKRELCGAEGERYRRRILKENERS